LRVTGGPVPVVEGVRRTTGATQFSFSDSGSLIYVEGPTSFSAQQQLALVDRRGMVESLKVPPARYSFVRRSPDGKRLAYTEENDKTTNIWIYEMDGATAPRQLTSGGANRYPVWSADGEHVAFQSDREGDPAIFWQRADGAGVAERLTKPEQGVSHIPESWSPDRQYLSFSAIKGTEGSVWILSVADKKATVFAHGPSLMIHSSAFSPDGRWLAYSSNEMTETSRVWVQPFPNTTGAHGYPIFPYGHPMWSPEGKELLYNSSRTAVSAVSITTRPSFGFGAATVIQVPVGGNSSPTMSPRNIDIMPDGRLILPVPADEGQPTPSGPPQIQVVLNWFTDLQQRVPGK
jgi:Tol biopolymer transport system component